MHNAVIDGDTNSWGNLGSESHPRVALSDISPLSLTTTRDPLWCQCVGGYFPPQPAGALTKSSAPPQGAATMNPELLYDLCLYHDV